MSRRTFWIVWCVGGGNPTVMQPSAEIARAEAERLARQNPGRDFVVCRALASFRKADVVETKLEGAEGQFIADLDEEIPF